MRSTILSWNGSDEMSGTRDRLCSNFYLREGDRRFDASPVIDADGAILGISKMVHIVQAPCFYEQDYYTPADTASTFTIPRRRYRCGDLFRPPLSESIRTCVLKARRSSSSNCEHKIRATRLFEWEMRVSAVQSGVLIAMCNGLCVEARWILRGVARRRSERRWMPRRMIARSYCSRTWIWRWSSVVAIQAIPGTQTSGILRQIALNLPQLGRSQNTPDTDPV